jgi:acyl-CoA thioester hydrolase
MTDTGAFLHRAQLRFSDTDPMGHVNHARFLAYLEDARIAMLQSAGERESLWDRGIILAKLEIDYLRPIHLALDPIDVWVWVSHIGRSSFSLGYRIEQDGETAARATTVIVAYDYPSSSVRLLANGDRAALELYQSRA